MSLPIVAIVGRPNVGKSTLVNRLAENNEAIVHEMRGVTRDRSYHEADWNGRAFKIIDTGGIEMGSDDAFQGSITAQALAAADEADIIIFCVERHGRNRRQRRRRWRRPASFVAARSRYLLSVNKLDNAADDVAMWEFMQLGLGEPRPVSALHGTGTGDLLDEVVSLFPEDDGEEDDFDSINVAIIGRPNAGKSSLADKLTNNDRSIVSNVAGTTRDAIDTTVEHEGRFYTIVDTGGSAQEERY